MEIDPLVEWNCLNKENAIQDMISVAYQCILSRTSQLDLFCTWLLAGSGATAALMITNASNLFTIMGKFGFKSSLAWLVCSSLCGIIAKFIYIFFQFGGDPQTKMLEQIKPILDHFFSDKAKIEKAAAERGASIETDIDFMKLISDFVKPFPWPTKLIALRYLSKHQNNRQVGFIMPIRIMILQSTFCLLQALSFVGFIIQAVRYAARA